MLCSRFFAHKQLTRSFHTLKSIHHQIKLCSAPLDSKREHSRAVRNIVNAPRVRRTPFTFSVRRSVLIVRRHLLDDCSASNMGRSLHTKERVHGFCQKSVTVSIEVWTSSYPRFRSHFLFELNFELM